VQGQSAIGASTVYGFHHFNKNNAFELLWEKLKGWIEQLERGVVVGASDERIQQDRTFIRIQLCYFGWMSCNKWLLKILPAHLMLRN
jgi:hypothetical protein